MTHSSVNAPSAPHFWPLYRLLLLPGTQMHGEGGAEGDLSLQALVCGAAAETPVFMSLASLCGPRVQIHLPALFRRRQWHRTPVLLPGESQGRGSLVGCCLWGRTESDTTEATWQQQQQQHCSPTMSLLEHQAQTYLSSRYFLLWEASPYPFSLGYEWDNDHR